MNAIDLSTQARPQHYAQSSNQDDYQRATRRTQRPNIARSIAIALIFATIGLTEWYGSALYGNPLVSSQQNASARDGAPSVAYLPARYAIQAMEARRSRRLHSPGGATAAPQSALICASRITLPHRSMSDFTWALNSSGELAHGSNPIAPRRSRTSGSASAFTSSP